jgi:hypothetical protein
LDELAGLCVRGEYRTRHRIPNHAAANLILDLRHARAAGGDVLAGRLSLRASGFDLLAEHTIVAFRLIELLRRRGLLCVEATGALVGAPGDLALNLEHTDLLRDFVGARAAPRPLSDDLFALQRQLQGVDDADHGTSRQHGALRRSETNELTAGLGAHHDLLRLDVSVRVGFHGAVARRAESERGGGKCVLESRFAEPRQHHRTSRPSVVRR